MKQLNDIGSIVGANLEKVQQGNNGMFMRLPFALVDSNVLARLSWRALKVYLVLFRHAHIKTGVCCPDNKTICHEAGISKNWVFSAKQELEKYKLIKSWRKGFRCYYKIIRDWGKSTENPDTYLLARGKRTENSDTYIRDKKTGRLLGKSTENPDTYPPEKQSTENSDKTSTENSDTYTSTEDSDTKEIQEIIKEREKGSAPAQAQANAFAYASPNENDEKQKTVSKDETEPPNGAELGEYERNLLSERLNDLKQQKALNNGQVEALINYWVLKLGFSAAGVRGYVATYLNAAK